MYLAPDPFDISQNGDEINNISRIITSINFDRKQETSKRDDLESLAFLAVFLLKGTLPWLKYCEDSGDDNATKVAREKENYGWKMLSKGLPVEISLYLKYLNDLGQESPI